MVESDLLRRLCANIGLVAGFARRLHLIEISGAQTAQEIKVIYGEGYQILETVKSVLFSNIADQLSLSIGDPISVCKLLKFFFMRNDLAQDRTVEAAALEKVVDLPGQSHLQLRTFNRITVFHAD